MKAKNKVINVWDLPRTMRYSGRIPTLEDVAQAQAEVSFKAVTDELKGQIDIRRDNAFDESLFGSLEHQVGMQSKVRTYDEVLNLIKEMS